MECLKSLSLSRKFSGVLIILSAIFSVYLLYPSLLCNLNSALLAFTVGTVSTYPIISKVWEDVEGDWKGNVAGTGKGYRDFFEETLDEGTRKKIVRNHWKSVEWIVPYAFTVYLYLSFSILYFFGADDFLTLFAGSVFMVGFHSLRVQSELGKD